MNQLQFDIILPLQNRIHELLADFVVRTEFKDYDDLLETSIDGISVKHFFSLYLVDQPIKANNLKLDAVTNITKSVYLQYILENIDGMSLEKAAIKAIEICEEYFKLFKLD